MPGISPPEPPSLREGGERRSSATSSRERWLRLAGATLGLGLLAWFLSNTDRAALKAALLGKAHLVPLCVAVELLRVGAETQATRCVLGEARRLVSWPRHYAVHLVGFAFSVVVPAPRPAAEAAKASILAPTLGVARCVHVGVVIQTTTFLAVGTSSLACALFTPAPLLARLLMMNCAFLVGMGVTLRGLLRSPRLAGWLTRRLPRYRAGIALFHETAKEGRIVQATAWMIASVALQAMLFATLLAGHGAAGFATVASTAEGAHILSATIGVLVPGQVGVRELAFAEIAQTLGTDDAEAAALSLVPRAVQVGVALVGFVVLAVLRSRTSKAGTNGARVDLKG